MVLFGAAQGCSASKVLSLWNIWALEGLVFLLVGCWSGSCCSSDGSFADLSASSESSVFWVWWFYWWGFFYLLCVSRHTGHLSSEVARQRHKSLQTCIQVLTEFVMSRRCRWSFMFMLLLVVFLTSLLHKLFVVLENWPFLSPPMASTRSLRNTLMTEVSCELSVAWEWLKQLLQTVCWRRRSWSAKFSHAVQERDRRRHLCLGDQKAWG